jgi:hypothetical protein
MKSTINADIELQISLLTIIEKGGDWQKSPIPGKNAEIILQQAT